MAKTIYPFEVKSNKRLIPGQFWAIPLSSGNFACGRVIQLPSPDLEYGSRSMFLAGLMNWHGQHPPTEVDLVGRSVLEQGSAHIKTIRECGGPILGHRPLEADGIEPGVFLSQGCLTGCMLMRGYQVLGPASREDQGKYPVFSTWGYEVIKVLAEKRFENAG